jgi:hypothetical protein
MGEAVRPRELVEFGFKPNKGNIKDQDLAMIGVNAQENEVYTTRVNRHGETAETPDEAGQMAMEDEVSRRSLESTKEINISPAA